MKLVLALALVVAAAVALPGAARATDECNGLDVCISVPGPWVVVPGSPAGRARTVEYQLSCPRGSIVGGLDAVLGDRGLSVRFLGTLGSPVNPGITTAQSVVFVATYARRAVTSFRPLVGCIPASGGGGRSTTAVPQVRPPERRVRTALVPEGSRRASAVCRAGERLVGSSAVVAFRGRREPTASALAGVGASVRERGRAAVATARRSAAVPSVRRVEVQVHALCARGAA